MADLESLSDEELRQMAQAKMAQGSSGYESKSDDELKELARQKIAKDQAFDLGNENIISNVGKAAWAGLGAVGQALDPYMFGPTRAAVSKAQDADVYSATHDHPGLLGPVEGLMQEYIDKPAKAAWDQFGQVGSPTSKDIAAKAGASKEETIPMGPLGKVSPAGMLGAGVEMALPTGASAIGMLGKGAKAATGLIGKAPFGVAKDIGFLGQSAAELPQKVESLVSHLPEKNIQVFKERYPIIKQMQEKYKGNPLAASEDLRESVSRDVNMEKDIYNAQIENSLRDHRAANKPIIDSQPALKMIDDQIANLDPIVDKSTISELKIFRTEISKLAKKGDGFITPSQAWSLYRANQRRARGAFQQPGEMYTYAADPEISRTAKGLNSYFGSELKKIDKGLAYSLDGHSKVHKAEELLAPSVLTPAASANSIYRAGSYADEPARLGLEALGKITGKNYIYDAENIAAMRALYDPRLEGHGIMRAIGRPLVKGYEALTQPGIAGESNVGPFKSGRGYGTGAKGLIRGARIGLGQ